MIVIAAKNLSMTEIKLLPTYTTTAKKITNQTSLISACVNSLGNCSMYS